MMYLTLYRCYRKAGACPVSVESRPYGCGSNAQYFVAKVSPYQIKLAEKVGWRDPYSQLRVQSMLGSMEFLIEKKAAEVLPAMPDHNRPRSRQDLSAEQSKACLEYSTEMIFSKELDEGIDKMYQNIIDASKATGIDYFKIVDAKLPKK